MVERPTIDVPSLPGGWGAPWPNVAEIEAVLPDEKWTLVGGLMTQLHGIHRGIDTLRPTNDVDIVLHIETTRGVAAETASALESIGYEFSPSIDDRNDTAHRFKRASPASTSSPAHRTSSTYWWPTTRHPAWSRSFAAAPWLRSRVHPGPQTDHQRSA